MGPVSDADATCGGHTGVGIVIGGITRFTVLHADAVITMEHDGLALLQAEVQGDPVLPGADTQGECLR